MRLRRRRRSPSERVARSLPSTTTLPLEGANNPMIRLAVVVLPHPDSPTMASTSPGRSSRDTPSTALTSDLAAPFRTSRSRRGRGKETETWLRLSTVSDMRHRALLDQEAGGSASLPQNVDRRLLSVAALEGIRASRCEAAPGRDLVDPGRVARYRHKGPFGFVQVRERLEEKLGVRMLGVGVDIGNRA